MGKELYSFPELAVGDGALDLLGTAIRKSAGQDSKENKDTFKALILRAVAGDRITAKSVAGVVGAVQVKNPTRNVPLTRAYFVRIIDEDSPHAYLPNPCAHGTTGLAEAPNNHLIQGLHTYAIHEDSQRPLAPNTVVFVKLNKADFSYDTDIGWITGVVGHAGPEVEREFKCASPRDAYNSQDISTIADALGITDKQLEPTGITLHYTAGGTVSSAIIALADSHLAYHYIIDRDGSVEILSEPDKVVFHDPATNYSHVGISFVNLGFQQEFAGRYGSPPESEWIVGPDPVSGKLLKWEPYTIAQINKAENLIRELKARFPEIVKVINHSDSREGKSDGGPALSPHMSKFISAVS
tara:strand:+ start:9359 stop:10420 length:1062 start_codon:yes stop_codon:yes gene_type:complete